MGSIIYGAEEDRIMLEFQCELHKVVVIDKVI